MDSQFRRRVSGNSVTSVAIRIMFALGLLWRATWVAGAWAAPDPNQAEIISGVRYGATAQLGPGLEACATSATNPAAIVVGPTDDWEAVLTHAQPGAMILLRGGNYQASAKLWLPAGAPGQLITIKPYNCEEVTLFASLRPLAYTVIAGLTIEARTLADSHYVIRIDSEYKGAYWGNITQVTLRNNNLYGGLTDAIRISEHTTAITITGNQIDGGGTGHNIFVTAEKRLHWPDQILITNNRLSKRLLDTAAEDMFQVRDVGYVEFTYNTCTDGNHMEQCVDIKTTTTPLLIAHNFFEGDQLHRRSAGEDGSNGCMVIHETDGVAEQHLIEHNFFKHCQGAAIRFAASSAGDEISSGIVRHNLFYQRSHSVGALTVAKANQLHFANNTVICGHLRLGNSAQTNLPTNLVLKNNIFYKTKIEDNTLLPAHSYTCAYNLLFATVGNGFTTSGCTNNLEADPQFAAAASYNFQLLAQSPALHTGEAGAHIGAFSMLPPATALAFASYLPIIQTSPPLSAEIDCAP